MKKQYNSTTTNDMPMDTYFTPYVEKEVVAKKEKKKKINAIGKSTQNKINNSVLANSSQNLFNTSNSNNSYNIDQKTTDLEKINEDNIKRYRFKVKRNRMVIVLLSVMLVLAIASITVYLAVAQLENNCKMNVHGVRADFIIDGENVSRFRAPANLQGNARIEMKIELKVKESGMYNIWFVANCYQKDVLLNNTLIYEKGDNFMENADGSCRTKKSIYISKNQVIYLCGGVILDYEYKDSLNIDNFRMEFDVYFEEV